MRKSFSARKLSTAGHSRAEISLPEAVPHQVHLFAGRYVTLRQSISITSSFADSVLVRLPVHEQHGTRNTEKTTAWCLREKGHSGQSP